MTTWLGFLRAINLGRNRKFPQDDIRAAVEAAGFDDVETYINTGNIRFATRMRSRPRIEAALEAAFLADRGFPVLTVCFTPAELREVAVAVENRAGGEGRQYVELLRDPPPPNVRAEIEAGSHRHVTALLGPRALLLTIAEGEAPGPAIAPGLVRRLGVSTNRNTRVVTELASRWGE